MTQFSVKSLRTCAKPGHLGGETSGLRVIEGVAQYLPAVLPTSGMRIASGAFAVVFGFTSTGGFGISFGGTGIGFTGATIAGPVEQPVAAGAQVSHELDLQNRALRRSNRPILLPHGSQSLAWKPVYSGLLINGVPQAFGQAGAAQAGAQATGAGAQATGAQAGAQLFEQLNFALMRENSPMRGPQPESQDIDIAGASQPPQPAALMTTGAWATGAA